MRPWPAIDSWAATAAKAASYLVGPYDTYNNAQPPRTAEDFLSRWPGTLFPEGCVIDAGGKPFAGFASRGCELRSEAPELLARKPIAARLDRQLQHSPSRYLLVVDAFGQLHDDFSDSPPMTAHKDRANRLSRMHDARASGVDFGSEHGTAARFDPAFRIPLYEAAFHDAVVSTDRWDMHLPEFPHIIRRRVQLELLYSSPSIGAMDRSCPSSPNYLSPYTANFGSASYQGFPQVASNSPRREQVGHSAPDRWPASHATAIVTAAS